MFLPHGVLAILAAKCCMSDTGGGSGGTLPAPLQPFNETFTLAVDTFVTPNTFTSGFLPLELVANPDGDAPTLTVTSLGTAGATGEVISNTGSNAAAVPFGLGFVPVVPLVEATTVFEVQNDGAVIGTVSVITGPSTAQTLTAGAPVTIPFGGSFPTAF